MKLSRRLTGLALKLLPRRLRLNVIRRGVRLNEAELSGVQSVHVARSTDDYLQAMKLVHDGYVKRGILAPWEAHIHMTHYLALPSTVVFVAVERDAIAGTVSLVEDSSVGLPMQKIYPHEIQALRDQGRKPAEVGALCVATGRRGTGMPYLLYKAMFLIAYDLLDVDDLVIAVHPDAADLYSGSFNFERIGPVRPYPTLEREALAVAMRLDLRTMRAVWAQKWGQLPKTAANPYWLYFERKDPQIILPHDRHQLEDLRDNHRKASMKLAALRPDIVLELDPAEFQNFRREVKSKEHP